jgi:type I restriction enzyme, S subunit
LHRFVRRAEYRAAARATMQSGVGQARVPREFVEETQLPLPPLSEQRRIVAKLDELLARTNAALSAIDAISLLLARCRKAVLASAFRGDLTAQWRKDVPSQEWAESGSSAAVELPVFVRYPLPPTWRWCLISDLCTVVRGASPRPAGDPRFFHGDHTPWITVGELTRDNAMFLDSTSTFLTAEGRTRSRYIEPNTLLLTNSGATLGVPKVTRIGGCINDGSVALLGLDERDREFLYYYLAAQTGRLRALNQGAAQPNLNTGIVRSIPVPWPPEAERQIILEVIAERLQLLDHVSRGLDELTNASANLERGILIKAFRGELVPHDFHD